MIRVDVKGARAHIRHLQRSMVEEFNSASINSATPFGAMRRQWAKRYEVFVRKRFNANSRGTGDGSWPPLALTTIVGRERKGGFIKRGAGKNIGGKMVYASRVGYISLARDTRFREGPDLGGFHFGRLTGAIVRSTQKGKGFGKLVGIAVAILKDTGLLFNALTIGTPGNRLEGIPNGVRFGFTNIGHPNKHGKGKNPTIAQIAKWHNEGVPSKSLPKRLILATPDDVTRAGMTKDALRAIDRVEREWRKGGRK